MVYSSYLNPSVAVALDTDHPDLLPPEDSGSTFDFTVLAVRVVRADLVVWFQFGLLIINYTLSLERKHAPIFRLLPK